MTDTYYTYQDWIAAGRPEGNETNRVIIGENPNQSTPAISETTQQEQQKSSIDELQSTLDFAKQVESGSVILPEDVNISEFNNSIKDIQTKLDLANKSKELKQIPESERTQEQSDFIKQADAISTSKLRPFIDTNTNTLNLKAALQAGIDLDKPLQDLGVSPVDIATTQKAIGEQRASVMLPKTPTVLTQDDIDAGFRILQSQGKIPKDAIYQGFDRNNNQYSYFDISSLSPELYSIYQNQGYKALSDKITEINIQYQDFQNKLASGDILALPDGQYITKEQFDKQSQGTQQILKISGFEGLDYLKPRFTYKGKVYTEEELKPILDKAIANKEITLRNIPYVIVPTPETTKRTGIQVAAMIIPPIKATLPEYTIKDVSATDWILGGVNAALIPLSFTPGLAANIALKSVSTIGAGTTVYETTKNWNDLSIPEKTLGAAGTLLYALPLLSSVARGIKISESTIPTKTGDIVTWKGLSVFDNPVIGKSDGKFVVGARNITIPEAKMILDGYKPESMLETKVFVNENILKNANFSQPEIDYLKTSLQDRNLFAGKPSPYLNKEAILEPTERLDADEVSTMLQQIQKAGKDIDNIEIYGSATTKAQLAPELANWRGVHDWDIQTSVGATGTKKFADDMLSALKELPGNRKYKIDPKNPTHILKEVDGEWKGIADIHSHEISSIPTNEIPKSKLDATNDYSYGRLVAEPVITVNYPGIGKFDIMRLSEAGVRKADTLLRVRQAKTGTGFNPPERGIATLSKDIVAPAGISAPGIPKDAADFYVILRTFKGQKVANDWAEAWARANTKIEGRNFNSLSSNEKANILNDTKKTFDDIAKNTPSDIIGWKIKPSSTIPANASPEIRIITPGSLAPLVSNSLKSSISIPVKPYANINKSLVELSPSEKTSISNIVSKVLTKPSASNTKPSLAVNTSPFISSYKLTSPNIVIKSPSLIKPSKSLSNPSISVPTAPISPKITPIPPVEKIPPSAPINPIYPTIDNNSKKTSLVKELRNHPLTFFYLDYWITIYPPYGQANIKLTSKPPANAIIAKGKHIAYKTIQALGGEANTILTIDAGIKDIIVDRPAEAGKPYSIRFKSDPFQKTKSQLTLKGLKVTV